MSVVQLNLDANTYSDEQLRQKFRLPADYTRDDIDVATRRLLQTAQTTLGSADLQMFRQFVNDASQRLLRQKAPEYADDVGALLPTDRQLTTLPTAVVGALAPTSASLAPPPPVTMATPGFPQVTTPPAAEQMPTSAPWREMRYRAHRVVHIDSQYRQNIATLQSDGSAGTDGAPLPGSNAFNTDFTLDLAEPLSNVLEMKLHAFNIPTTWYDFDSSLGNTIFSVTIDGSTQTTHIDDGNYTIEELCAAIQAKAAGLPGGSNVTVAVEENTNRVTLAGAAFTFYKRGGLQVEDGSVEGGSKINQNLGWALGFRKTPADDDDGTITIDATDGVTAEAAPCAMGPKYFVLSVDDFNQNQQNKGLILATDDHGPVNAVRPSRMPTTQTTKAQLETQTALLLRNTNPNQRSMPPQTPNAFATLLFANVSELRPEPFIKVSTALHVYSRSYNGPTDIERLRVRLFDDKGNLVNLNDNDWSFSLVFEQLY